MFEAEPDGEPYSATVRFTGRRIGVRGLPRASDSFERDETIDGIVPGSGPVAITTWTYGVAAGEWAVAAKIIRPRTRDRGLPGSARSISGGAELLPAASWSWRRWSLTDGQDRPIKTRWALLAPLAPTPAVVPGVYTALAVAGIVIALLVQAAILGHEQLPVDRPLVVSGLALAAGLLGAKLWYAALHPDESIIRGGWAVDGFLIVAPLAALAGLLVFEVPIGAYLDATTPGLFLAVAIGRIGCFFTGCCAGRCTNARWGIWSSDRRVGARRIPTQLLESAAGLVIAGVAWAVVAGFEPPVGGAVFLASFAIYAAVRQGLLRLRAEQRRSPRSLPATAVAAVAVLMAIVAAQAVQAG